MDEKKLEEELKVYRELAKQDKKIDVASLMINALQKHHDNLIPHKQKRWAYLISVGVPPFGLFFAAKFYWSGKDDGQEAAMICLALTAFSILVFVLIGKLLLSGSGANLQDIQKINPKDIQDLVQ